ncbi:MAG TPA: DUF1329 domain-containing protein [Candidatus Binataceae bacterium]|jgi:hypothetical protein|nr:DUF1329 domain-containing protein [Candidatus Binataceae bacterium]
MLRDTILKWAVVVMGAVVLTAATTALAQDLGTYDDKLIAQLSPADSADSIPPGTKITAANWQQYRKFMTISLQAFMSGKYYWNMGSEPDHYIEVGPTIPTELPGKYISDTEKYSGQAQLVKLPSGAYEIKNYAAGIPFPHPSGPDMAAQLLYNFYYTYIPGIYTGYYNLALIDSYGSIAQNQSRQIFFKLSHVSDAGEPMTNPQANGLYLSINNEVLSPEQSKYTTAMSLFPDDPRRVPELYVFLPSLRRSLRLSSVARCAPLQGTDWTNDDQRGGFSGIPNWFTPRYLGEKKLLFMVHSQWQSKASQDDKFIGSFTLTGKAFGWPKAQETKVELRDVYVIDLVPTAEMKASYCYSHRVLYLDKDLAYTADQADTWDRNGKLWKLQFIPRGATTAIPSDLTGKSSFVMPSGGELGVIYDIQANHASIAWPSTPPTLLSKAPKELHDLSIYALPSGLNQIMK